MGFDSVVSTSGIVRTGPFHARAQIKASTPMATAPAAGDSRIYCKKPGEARPRVLFSPDGRIEKPHE